MPEALPNMQIDPGAVRAPRAPGLPTPRVADLQVGTPQVATPRLAELPSPLREVANTLSKASDETNDVAKLYAKQAGYQAVTRDSDGNLVVAQAPIVGDAAIAYHSAVKYTALSMGEAEAKRQDLVLSKQFHDNPDGYLEAAQAFRKKHVEEFAKAAGPDVGAELGRSIDNSTTQNYRWLVLEQQRNIKHQFDAGTQARLESTATDAISLIQSGAKPGDPAVQRLIDQYVQTSKMRVQNPVLGESPDVAALRLKKFDLTVGAARYTAGINQILQNPAGGIQAAQEALDSHMQEKGVDPTQRALDYSEGQKAIKDHIQNLERSINLANKAKKIGDEQQEDAIIRDAASPSPTITENDIKTNSNMSPEAKMRMLGWIKRDGMPEPLAKVSQGTSTELFRRMNLPEDDPQRITDLREVRTAYVNGTLKRQDEEWLEQRFKEQRSPMGEKLKDIKPQFYKSVEPLIDKSNPLLGKIDQSGKLQAYRFQRFVEDKVSDYIANKKDPSDLFNPSKPEFLGSPEVLKPFQTDIATSIKTIGNNFRSNPAPTSAPAPGAPARAQRNPGESPADFLKRTGGGVVP